MRAGVLYEPGTPLSIEEVRLDPPRAGEVRVRVAAAGVGHSDLHLADGPLGDGRVTTVAAICPKRVDHAFEAVGRPETIREAWQVLRPGATAVVVGLVPKGVEVSLPGFDLLSEKGLKGCFYGSTNAPVDLRALAELADAGRLDLGDVVSHVTTLEGIEDAFERLRRGTGARSVVVIDRELAQAPE